MQGLHAYKWIDTESFVPFWASKGSSSSFTSEPTCHLHPNFICFLFKSTLTETPLTCHPPSPHPLTVCLVTIQSRSLYVTSSSAIIVQNHNYLVFYYPSILETSENQDVCFCLYILRVYPSTELLSKYVYIKPSVYPLIPQVTPCSSFGLTLWTRSGWASGLGCPGRTGAQGKKRLKVENSFIYTNFDMLGLLFSE